MFKLQLFDHHGNALKLGDILRVNTGQSQPQSFYSRLTWLKEEQAIAPFHTFSFHSFEKVDSLPENAVKSTEARYDIWYAENNDDTKEVFENYLMSWRQCEDLLKDRCFRIVPDTQLALF